MTHVSTHILDTSRGRPAAGVAIALTELDSGARHEATTDDDGRAAFTTAGGGSALRLEFAVGAYFESTGTEAFFPRVVVEFAPAVADERCHVPLLISPFTYSTYRGS